MGFWFDAFAGLFSAALPTAASLVRFRKTERNFLPFLLLMPIGFATELCSFFLARNGYSNLFFLNIYLLVEAICLTWQFREWGLFSRTEGLRKLYWLLQAGWLAGWIIEGVTFGLATTVQSYFIIVYSFGILVMSADTLAAQIVDRPFGRERNPVYWICSGLLLFFTASLVSEFFWAYGLKLSPAFRRHVLALVGCTNIFANVLYFFAILWIPTKFRYLRLP